MRSSPQSRQGPIRAAIYSRVSTEDQAEDGTTSLDDQERTCRDHIDRHGWEFAGVWREDGTTGNSSGKTFDRPRWQDLEATCYRGEVDAIVCARLSRFSRGGWRGDQKAEELRQAGIGLVLLDVQIDTTTPNGRMMLSVLLAGARWERETIVERLAKGQYGKAREGRWPSARAGAPFGLQVEGTGRDARLVEHEQEAATIRKAAALLVDDRLDIAAACRVLNGLDLLPRKAERWYPDLLRQVMSERARMGEIIWGKTERSASGQYGEPTPIPGVPAVLTSARFGLVQLALKRRAVPRPLAPSRVYPLSVRMISPCGLVYHGVTRNDMGLSQYICQGVKSKQRPGWKSCGCTRLKAAEIEARVWAEVTALLSDPERLRELAQAYLGASGEEDREAELDALGRQISHLESRLSAGLANGIRAGLDADALATAVAQVEDELAALRMRRDAIARWVAEGRQRHDAIGRLAATAPERLASMSLAEQAETLALLEVRVEVLDATKTPALRVTGVIGSSGIPSQEPRNPGRETRHRGSDRATGT
jgi:DNA invertase Pin-like site-specific DNA recombinase